MRVGKLIDEVVMFLSFVCMASILGQLFNCYYYLAIFTEALKSCQALNETIDFHLLNIGMSPLLAEVSSCLCVSMLYWITFVVLFITHLIILKRNLRHTRIPCRRTEN